MKNLSKEVKSFMRPLIEAHQEANEHAPLELHGKPTVTHRDLSMRMFKLMYEEALEYKDAIQDAEMPTDEKLIQIADALADMDYILSQMFAMHGMAHLRERLFDEVHSSNMTKLNNGKVILREDGKVLKPKGYLPPKIKDFLFDYSE